MRKIKIILVVLAILSSVGWALAIRATHRFNGTMYCTTSAGICPTSVKYIPVMVGKEMYCRYTGSSGDCNIITEVAVNP